SKMAAVCFYHNLTTTPTTMSDVIDTCQVQTINLSVGNHPILLNAPDFPLAWRTSIDITAVWPMHHPSMIEPNSPYVSVGICDILIDILIDICYDNISICIVLYVTPSIVVQCQSIETTYLVGDLCGGWTSRPV